MDVPANNETCSRICSAQCRWRYDRNYTDSLAALVTVAGVCVEVVNRFWDRREVCFADQRCGKADLLQLVKVGRERLAVLVVADAVLVDPVNWNVDTSEDGRARRRADRRHGVAVGEADAFCRKLVDVWGDCKAIAVRAQGGSALLVRTDEQDVVARARTCSDETVCGSAVTVAHQCLVHVLHNCL